MYPINTHLNSIIDKILTDPRWDLKFIGMQIVIEGLALSAFNTTRETTPDPVLKDIVYLVTRDEARHVTFGVNYLEEYVQTSPTRSARRGRCSPLKPARSVASVSWRRMYSAILVGMLRKVGARYSMGFVMSTFRNLLFQRVVPNLRRIGLLTDTIRPRFEELGILEYESMTDDGDIDWAKLERPLDTSEAQSHEQSMLAAFHEAFEAEQAAAG